MEPMAICIDIAKCTACRACQVACKNWNQLKAEQTENRGNHENPPDLSANTWNRIIFMETQKPNDIIEWSFFSERCRHCDFPPCADGAESVPGAVVRHDSGAVVYTGKITAIDYDDFVSYCPFDIPRKDEATGRIVKCNMCIDRITNGLKPACVTTCSTGALNFGTKAEMLDYAKKRMAKLGQDANLYPGEEFSTFWILPEKQDCYPLASAGMMSPYDLMGRKRLSGVFGGMILAEGMINFLNRKSKFKQIRQ